MVDHLRPWDQPLREVLSAEATGKYLLGHEFPSFPRAVTPPDYWVSSGWLYEEGTIGTESGVNGYAKHDDYGGYVRGRKPNDPDRTTGFRIRAKEAEILLAIEAGLDGFVHNLVDATPGSAFERRWLDVAEAAENLYTAGTLGDFRVALCPDGNTGGTPRNAPTDDPTDLEDLIVAHGARNSCLRLPEFSDRQLLFSFSPETAPDGTSAGGATPAAWWAARKTAVAARGEPVAFAAIFQNTWTATAQAPSFTSVADIFGRWGGSDWSSVTGANNQNATAAAYSMSQYGKPWCHWSRWQDVRPYDPAWWEPWGSTLLRNTWAVIEASDPYMVQSVTWDDYSEGTQWYAGDPYFGFTPADVQMYHAIKWKLGAFPTIVRDGLFLFHRVQPRSGVTYTSTQQTSFMSTSPEAGGAAKDEVEILAYLKAPATIYATSGGDVTPFAGSAGENSFKIPLTNGTVQAWAVRSGVTVASVTSPFEVSTTQLVQDFNYRAVQSVSEEDEEGDPLATPDTISDLIGWWEPNTGTNGATVNPWSSTSSYGPDLDDTAGTAPTLDTSVALNGYNGTRFTSTRTLRQTTAGDLTGYANAIGGASMFVVAKLDDATGAQARRAAVVATGVAGAGSTRFGIWCVTGVPQWGARRLDGVGISQQASGASIGTSAAHIMSGTIDYATTTQKFYVDAAQVATSSSALSSGTTSTDSAGVGIGSHPGNATEGWPGVVYEVILYSRALTTLERMTVHAYLSDKYSITIVDALILPLATFGTMTTTIPEPNVGLDVSITPAAISTTTTVPSATKSGGARAVPAAVSTTTTTPSRTVSGGALFLASLTTTTTTAPAHAVSGGATSVPAVISSPTTTAAWTVSGGATSVPDTASTTTSMSAASVATGGEVTPSAVSMTTAVASPGVATSGNATVSATVVSTVGTIPTAAVSAGCVFQASLVSTLTTSDGVTVAGHVFIDGGSVACVVSVPVVDLSSGVTGEPDAVAVPVSFVAGVLTTTGEATPDALLTVATFPLADPSAGIEFEVASFEATSLVPVVVASGGAAAEPAAVLAPVLVDVPTVTVPPPLIRARGREISTHVPRGREVT